MRYRITIEIDAAKINRQLLNEAATIGAHNIAKQVELIANGVALVYVSTEIIDTQAIVFNPPMGKETPE